MVWLHVPYFKYWSNKLLKVGFQDNSFWPFQHWRQLWRRHGDKYYILRIFLFCLGDGAIIVLQDTGGTVHFCICGEFQLQSCTFSTCHCWSAPLHVGFLLRNTTGGCCVLFFGWWGFCFVFCGFGGFFVVVTEHIFWEQYDYMRTLVFIYFFFVPSTHFWKVFLRLMGSVILKAIFLSVYMYVLAA